MSGWTFWKITLPPSPGDIGLYRMAKNLEMYDGEEGDVKLRVNISLASW
jgi:hypothetical protein